MFRQSVEKGPKDTQQAVMGAPSGKEQAGICTHSACSCTVSFSGGRNASVASPWNRRNTPGPRGPRHVKGQPQSVPRTAVHRSTAPSEGPQLRDAKQRIFTKVPAARPRPSADQSREVHQTSQTSPAGCRRAHRDSITLPFKPASLL